ncbi:MAG: helix-turn-helix transcriptional regulator [Clostridia bacterium]|nr:helix-turn-helix transcriptional regulator [Clostridia bacterium]
MNLEEFISAITPQNNVFICVKDSTGITQKEPFCVHPARQILSTPYCMTAKTIPGALMRCIAEVDDKNARAMQEKQPFVQICHFGVTTVVHPVVVNDLVLCILYASGLTTDMNKTVETIKETCKKLKGNSKNLLKKVKTLQHTNSITGYLALTEAIAEYIKLLLLQTGSYTDFQHYHPAVQDSIAQMQASYHKNISLVSCAEALHMNPKYLGRLFRNETKNTFHEYLNNIRITRAKDLLYGTSVPVIEIALSCGYNTVTYFNRIFKQNTGYTPTDFRRKFSPFKKEKN